MPACERLDEREDEADIVDVLAHRSLRNVTAIVPMPIDTVRVCDDGTLAIRDAIEPRTRHQFHSGPRTAPAVQHENERCRSPDIASNVDPGGSYAPCVLHFETRGLHLVGRVAA